MLASPLLYLLSLGSSFLLQPAYLKSRFTWELLHWRGFPEQRRWAASCEGSCPRGAPELIDNSRVSGEPQDRGQRERLGEEVESEVAPGAEQAWAGETHRMSVSLAVHTWASRGAGTRQTLPVAL